MLIFPLQLFRARHRQPSTDNDNTKDNTRHKPFYRNTGENDPYDVSIASRNIYENQVIPIGLHNLSKRFRPNISTVQVLSLGTIFIPKWKFQKKKRCI